MKRPEPKCPIRLGESCSLCYPGASGPEDCGLVWLVREDPELMEQLNELRREQQAETRARKDAAHSVATSAH
ncbi:DUF6767 domain-containing protein [Granulicoccus phenolivorans]|uniref:DUF6767 domain-containing protein n=1 Tax=Granulicoccus phenolivorans TaxID=266854 RepID=UPI0009DC078D|nr:DUF6767 domain-containing protein [Granulicoccus phenolivorans]